MNIDHLDIQKLLYLLNNITQYFEIYVQEMVDHPEKKRPYSALELTKILQYYIEIMNDLGEKQPNSNEKEFFAFDGFTEEKYTCFQKLKCLEQETNNINFQ